ncbi:hypothetical protein QMU85_002427 [Photobacterium damselae]|nr:hypothetical protein [Photobacterium damselae]
MKKIPNKFILIEGIDGSGKDTFTDFLIDELKLLYTKTNESSISKVGQPFSELSFGEEAKKFVEDFIYYSESEQIEHILKQNRLSCEKYYEKFPGIIICVRGLLTDLATLKRLFPQKSHFDIHGNKKIDSLIIIDVESEIADQRIEQRGIARTWREKIAELMYFRDFYLNYHDDSISDKKIITALNKEHLREMASSIAFEIYQNA